MATGKFKKWWLLLLKGVILILLSIIILSDPGRTIIMISVFMGISLIVTGIVLLFISSELRKSVENWTIRLAEGLLDIVFGFFLLAHPDVGHTVVPLMIGFWVIFYGVLILSGSFQFKEEMKFRQKTIMLVGIITIILGFIIAYNPNITIVSISILIGVPILIIGLANIFFAINMKHLDQDGTTNKIEEKPEE